MRFKQLPNPVMHADSAPFWYAAREGKLLLKRCASCEQMHFYPRPHCPFCGAARTQWTQSAGTGHVYSFSIVRGAPKTTAAAVVELAEGVRLTSVIVDADVHALAIGDEVAVATIPLRRRAGVAGIHHETCQ